MTKVYIELDTATTFLCVTQEFADEMNDLFKYNTYEGAPHVEIEDEWVKRYNEVSREYHKMQGRLEDLWRKHRKKGEKNEKS